MPDLEVYDRSTMNAIEKLLAESGFTQVEDGTWCHSEDTFYDENDGECYHIDDGATCDNCGNTYHQDGDWYYPEHGGECYCSPDCIDEAGYYQHDDGCWYSDPPEDELDEDGLLCGSTTNRHDEGATPERPFRIGFEVEKEDSDVIYGIQAEAQRRKWIAVYDGSLSYGKGFELVSPCYNVANIDAIRTEITNFPALDADTSSACGGHINVSEYGLDGPQFAEKHQQLTALLAALYLRRLRRGMSIMEKPRMGKRKLGDKYRAVNVRRERVEYRMPSRVKTRRQLIWRLELFHHCLHNPTTIVDSLRDKDSWLYQHLAKVYSTEKIAAKADFCRDFYLWETGSPASELIRDYVREYDY